MCFNYYTIFKYCRDFLLLILNDNVTRDVTFVIYEFCYCAHKHFKKLSITFNILLVAFRIYDIDEDGYVSKEDMI